MLFQLGLSILFLFYIKKHKKIVLTLNKKILTQFLKNYLKCKQIKILNKLFMLKNLVLLVIWAYIFVV